MKIAIYSGVIPSTTFIENLILGLGEKGETVYLFGRINRKVNYRNKNIHVHGQTSNKLLFAIIFFIRFLRLAVCYPKRCVALFRIVREKKSVALCSKYLPVLLHLPDIFHVQWAKGIEEWLFLKEFGVKLIVSFRGTHINISPVADAALAEMYQRVLQQYDGFHCVSKAILAEGLKYGASSEKSCVIYPAVNDALIASEISYTKNKTLTFLSVGRNHWKKAYNIALDACKILKDNGLDFSYKIVAEKNIEELEYQISDLKLEDHIEFLGQLSHNEVLELYKTVDFCLLPSVEEGVANVVLEAMALGCPVLSSDCGGMTEVITDGVNGIIFSMRNPDAIAEAISRFAQLPEEKIREMIAAAQKTIAEKHVKSKQIEEMLHFYKRIV